MNSETPFPPIQEARLPEEGVYSKHLELVTNPKEWLISEVEQLEDEKEMTFENFQVEVGSSRSKLLDKRFGLRQFIPETQLVWGKNEQGEETGFILRRRIQGRKLESLVLTKEIGCQLDEFVSGALKLYRTTVDEDGYGDLPDMLEYETPAHRWFELASPPQLKNFLIGHYPLIRGGKHYLGLVREAILQFTTDDGKTACPNALKLLKELGYEDVVYATKFELRQAA